MFAGVGGAFGAFREVRLQGPRVRLVKLTCKDGRPAFQCLIIDRCSSHC